MTDEYESDDTSWYIDVIQINGNFICNWNTWILKFGLSSSVSAGCNQRVWMDVKLVKQWTKEDNEEKVFLDSIQVICKHFSFLTVFPMIHHEELQVSRNIPSHQFSWVVVIMCSELNVGVQDGI